MARRQAGAGKPHSGGKAIVLAGHTFRLTNAAAGAPGAAREVTPHQPAAVGSAYQFRSTCFRVVLYNERCNSDVSARAPERATPCATPGARALDRRTEDTRSTGIRGYARGSP